jgi:hypothetical protein
MEKWKKIEDFPSYSVSSFGRVRNDDTQSLVALTENQSGIIKVALQRGPRDQVNRSVALLVAKAFLPPPATEHFTTPIHLDGFKANNNVDNLVWRPRWFAVRFHQQFDKDHRLYTRRPFVDIETGEPFRDGLDAARKYGLLDKDIMLSIANNTYVFPTHQRFHYID